VSKDNRFVPPAIKRDSRLIDSVVSSRKYKRPNAQKRGVYATPVIIPGEDPNEFAELLAELLDEWKPKGPSLRNAVHCVAHSMWLLRRLKNSVQTELYINTFDPRHPAFNEVWGFAMFMSCLRSEPETCFEKHAIKYLRADKIDYLKQKFPRSNYQSTAEWATAITAEIISLGYESPESDTKFEDLEAKLEDLKITAYDFRRAAREWRAAQQVNGSIVYARELLEYESKENRAPGGEDCAATKTLC
jgi:hypothetical protein